MDGYNGDAQPTNWSGAGVGGRIPLVVCSCAIHGLVALQSLEKHTNDQFSVACLASDVLVPTSMEPVWVKCCQEWRYSAPLCRQLRASLTSNHLSSTCLVSTR